MPGVTLVRRTRGRRPFDPGWADEAELPIGVCQVAPPQASCTTSDREALAAP
jgi:hypothetical protein